MTKRSSSYGNYAYGQYYAVVTAVTAASNWRFTIASSDSVRGMQQTEYVSSRNTKTYIPDDVPQEHLVI